MPTTEPVNIQQILQMGTHVEKLQQTMQELPLTTTQQLNAERVIQDELKRTEIQDTVSAYPATEADSENPNRKRDRVIRNAADQDEEEEQEELSQKEILQSAGIEGKEIDLIV